eukprot:TRINITY_DN11897_c0_g2_i1.p1 TRINITY_DN11897_c0_g2~~TRINITY_DN11897_c0_g2_i1.p1  ORF type:complete len:439 (-),score=60.88 TRINITY_DN11897_c0_g2_i1:613-1929(-)
MHYSTKRSRSTEVSCHRGDHMSPSPSPPRRMTRRAAAAMAESQVASSSPFASPATTAEEESVAIAPASPPRRMTRRAAAAMTESKAAPRFPFATLATTPVEKPVAIVPPSPPQRMTRRAAAIMAESQSPSSFLSVSVATTAAEESVAMVPPSPPQRMTRRAAAIMAETQIASSSAVISPMMTMAKSPTAFSSPSPPRSMTRRAAALITQTQEPPSGGSSGSQVLGPRVVPQDVTALAVDMGVLAHRKKGAKRAQGSVQEMERVVLSLYPSHTEATAEDPEMFLPSSRRCLTRRTTVGAPARRSDIEELPSGSCDSSILRAPPPTDDKTEDVDIKEPAAKRKCSNRLDKALKKAKLPKAPTVSVVVSGKPSELHRPVRAGFCRGAVVRILSDPARRRMIGILGDYHRGTDSWQVSGDFDLGSKWVHASNLAFFVCKRPK